MRIRWAADVVLSKESAKSQRMVRSSFRLKMLAKVRKVRKESISSVDED